MKFQLRDNVTIKATGKTGIVFYVHSDCYEVRENIGGERLRNETDGIFFTDKDMEHQILITYKNKIKGNQRASYSFSDIDLARKHYYKMQSSPIYINIESTFDFKNQKTA